MRRSKRCSCTVLFLALQTCQVQEAPILKLCDCRHCVQPAKHSGAACDAELRNAEGKIRHQLKGTAP